MREDAEAFRVHVANSLRELATEVLEGRADPRAVLLALSQPPMPLSGGFDGEDEFTAATALLSGMSQPTRQALETTTNSESTTNA